MSALASMCMFYVHYNLLGRGETRATARQHTHALTVFNTAHMPADDDPSWGVEYAYMYLYQALFYTGIMLLQTLSSSTHERDFGSHLYECNCNMILSLVTFR